MTTTTRPTHALDVVRAFEPSEPGALSGHEARCVCGHVARTSLSAAAATSDLRGHIAWAVKNGR